MRDFIGFFYYGFLVVVSIVAVFAATSCSTLGTKSYGEFGPFIIESPPPTEEAAESKPPYNPFSMAFTITRGMFYHLDLNRMLSMEEKEEFIRSFFSWAPLSDKELHFRIPDYFKRGDLRITIRYTEGSPSRFEWNTNALINPEGGKPLLGGHRYYTVGDKSRTIKGILLVRDRDIFRLIDLYSSDRENRLREKGELLRYAQTVLLDETGFNDKKGKFVVDTVLSTEDQPLERKGLASCVLTRYLLKRNKIVEAEQILEENKDTCTHGSSGLHMLYLRVKEEYLLTRKLEGI